VSGANGSETNGALLSNAEKETKRKMQRIVPRESLVWRCGNLEVDVTWFLTFKLAKVNVGNKKTNIQYKTKAKTPKIAQKQKQQKLNKKPQR
jgi:hypothetical protein